MNLSLLSDVELSDALLKLTGDERVVTLTILHHLNELERRGIFREAGYSSLFDYCTRKLRYSESSAGRRIAAARALLVNPELEGLFLNGAVTLCTIATAAKSMKNNTTAVAEICNKSKREVEALVKAEEVPAKPREVIRQVTVSAPAVPLFPQEKVEERVSVKFTLSKETYQQFEEARAKLSNSIDGELSVEAVFSKLLELFLKAPRKANQDSTTDSRYIQKQVKHEVYKRDGGKCCYVSADGTQCSAKTHLQFDHKHPFAAGGASNADNLRLLCPAHNKLSAEQYFGRSFIDGFVKHS